MAGKNQAKKWAVPVLAAVCLLCLAMMAAALVYTQSPAQGEFTPPPFEASAVSGTPEVPEELGWQELDAQAFQVGGMRGCRTGRQPGRRVAHQPGRK